MRNKKFSVAETTVIRFQNCWQLVILVSSACCR